MAGFRFFIFASIKYHSVVHFQRVQKRKFVRLKFNVLKFTDWEKKNEEINEMVYEVKRFQIEKIPKYLKKI